MPAFDNPESAWDCSRPILVAVNVTLVDSNDRDSVLVDLNATLKEISSRSPFTFVNIGPTNAIPTEKWSADAARSDDGPDVVVFFGNETDLMVAGAAAVGGAYRITDLDGSGYLRSGFVIINLLYFDDYQSGDGYLSRQALFAHELLHVLGLDHNERPDSVMTSRRRPLFAVFDSRRRLHCLFHQALSRLWVRSRRGLRWTCHNSSLPPCSPPATFWTLHQTRGGSPRSAHRVRGKRTGRTPCQLGVGIRRGIRSRARHWVQCS